MKTISVKTKQAIVDEEDFPLLSRFTWSLKQGYAITKINQATIGMHNLIMPSRKGCEIDHINRIKLDNRKKNLRIVSHWVNMHNRVKDNYPHFRGISFDKRCKKWNAQMTIKRKYVWLGSYNTAEEAARAYDNEVKKRFEVIPPGILNFPL